MVCRSGQSAKRMDADSRRLERAAQPSSQLHRPRSVGVHANRSDRRSQLRPVDRGKRSLVEETDHSRDHRLSIVQHGSRLRSRHEMPIGCVRPVGEHFLGLFQPNALGFGEKLRSRRAKDDERRVVLGSRPHNSARRNAVIPAGVVERAVRLDVRPPRCRPPGRTRRGHRAGRAQCPSTLRAGSPWPVGRSRGDPDTRPAHRCAPRRGPPARQVRRIVLGSPAWKPQATFADVTIDSSDSSSPSDQTPYPSPRSALRSTAGISGTEEVGDLVGGQAAEAPPVVTALECRNFEIRGCQRPFAAE
jgi:hypothetical protein